MADFNLVLGSVVFRDFEIPDDIDFGTEQAHHIHKLIGGGRVIDKTGADPKPIKWKGRMRGSAAESRCRSLDRLAASGAEVPVRWGGFFYSVVVTTFEAHYNRRYEIPYSIELTVSNVGGFGGIVATLASLIGADMGAISSLGALL